MPKKIDEKVLRQRLESLPVETLAEALLVLSYQGGTAEAAVNRLTATPEELVKYINSRLAGIRRRRKFLFRSKAPELATELSNLLRDIQSANPAPEKGMTLAAKFLQLDGKVFEICDDSYGMVGAVFHGELPEVFWQYAAAVTKEDKVIKQLMVLLDKDPWDMRSNLLVHAPQYLKPESIDHLADLLWLRTQKPQHDEDEQINWARHVKRLAKACHEPERYRQAALLSVRESWPLADLMDDGLTPVDALEVARLHLQCGEAAAALVITQEVAQKEGRLDLGECRTLMQQAHAALGNRDEEVTLARQRYDAAPSTNSLEELLVVIGETQRRKIVEETLQVFVRAEKMTISGLVFMLELERADLTAATVIAHYAELDGENYYGLRGIADALIEAEEYLAATLILRELVAANLKRANSIYYSHGVRYLVLAGKISGAVKEWGEHKNHKAYFEDLQEKHKRKVSFWKKYLVKK